MEGGEKNPSTILTSASFNANAADMLTDDMTAAVFVQLIVTTAMVEIGGVTADGARRARRHAF